MSLTLRSAFCLFAAFALTTSVALSKEDKEEKSAKDDEPKKVEKKSADLSDRVDALERQMHELMSMLKQQQQQMHKGEFDKNAKAPEKVPGKPQEKQFTKVDPDAKPKPKPGSAKEEEGAIITLKLAAKELAEVQKIKGEPKHGQVQLVKGKDGELLVPLKALPPGLQKQFLSQAGLGDGEKVKGKGDEEGKKHEKKKKDDDDDDDEKK